MVEFDVIVIGGGLNGLTAAAYLAKAGLNVAVFERSDELAPFCSTVEVTIPGFRHNLHVNQIEIQKGPVMEDLELERFGLELYGIDTGFGVPFLDGKAISVNSWDARVNYKTISSFSQKDGETLRKIFNQLGPHLQDLLQTLCCTPAPYQTPEVMDRVVNTILKCDVIPPDFTEMNAMQFVDTLFEDEHVKTFYVMLSEVIGARVEHRLVGALIDLLSIFWFGGPMGGPTTARGGVHRLPHSLAKAIIYHGGKIFQSCEVEKIIIKDGEAKGVRLSKDSAYPEREVTAKKAIISDLTAVPTFLHLVGKEHLEPAAVLAIKNYDYNVGIAFTAVYALNEPPKWESAKFDPGINRAWNFYWGADTMRDYMIYAGQIIRAEIPDPIVCTTGSGVPTLIDPTQAPPGKHTMYVWISMPHIKKRGGFEKWDELKGEVLDKITERINEYAPNFKKSILASYASSPLDAYRKNPSAINGNYIGGAMALGQLFERPFLGCGTPRTPIKRLYISNSTWPFGNSGLFAGYATAVMVAEDLNIRKQPWWVHRPLEYVAKFIERLGGQWRPTVD